MTSPRAIVVGEDFITKMELVEAAEETVCPQCAAEHVSYCARCDVAIYKNDLVFDRNSGEYVCPECYEASKETLGDRFTPPW